MSSRPFDLILFGATGFTGRLVAEYLVQNANCRWAIAGRNKSKLEKLRSDLGLTAEELPIHIADSSDTESLLVMVRQTRVIISTVGPYWKYGSGLVSSCVEANTDYVDLTGETPWVREMIDQHHEQAKSKKIKIVHCCGFDSIPSDLGVLVLQNAVQSETNDTLSKIVLYVGPSKGGISGGTFASMFGIFERSKDRSVRRVLGNPYGLNPVNLPKGQDGQDQMHLAWDPKQGVWTAPFVMAAINTKVVRRSHALMGFNYGSEFRYKEVTAFPKGVKGWCMGAALTLGLGAFVMSAVFPPTRWILQHSILPKPGEGPSETIRNNGYFQILLRGELPSGQPWNCLVVGERDPGYGQTAVMLAESALALVHQSEELPACYGVVTPASALGMTLVDRLRHSGMLFDVSTGKGQFLRRPT